MSLATIDYSVSILLNYICSLIIWANSDFLTDFHRNIFITLPPLSTRTSRRLKFLFFSSSFDFFSIVQRRIGLPDAICQKIMRIERERICACCGGVRVFVHANEAILLKHMSQLANGLYGGGTKATV